MIPHPPKNRQSGPRPLAQILPKLVTQIGGRAISYNLREGRFTEAARIQQTLALLSATASEGAP